MADPKASPGFAATFGSSKIVGPAQCSPTGVANNPGAGGLRIPPACPGTGSAFFTPLIEREANNPALENEFHNISCSGSYKGWSAEELRLADYIQDHRHRIPGTAGTVSRESPFPPADRDTVTALNSSFSRLHRVMPDTVPPFGTSTSPAAPWLGGIGQIPGFVQPTRNASGLFGSTTANSPFSAIKTTDTGTKDAPESSVKTKENEVEWLSNRYFGTTSISVKCGSDEKTYVFPREVLMQNFQHFRDQVSAEDTVHHHIATLAFARLVRWTQTSPGSREDPANPDGDYTVQDLLDEIIAAHHLGLDDANKFKTHICCLLATILLKDRRKLSSEHLELVTLHPAFSEDDGVMEVFVRAGLRPFLQSTMLSNVPVWNSTRAKPGHAKAPEWISILEHCRQLRKDNKDYALRVAHHVSETLEKCGRALDGSVGFYDTLNDDEVKGRRELGFSVVFNM